MGFVSRDGSSRLEYADTIHFNVGKLGSPTLGTPGTPTPSALSVFGQMHAANPMRIAVAHIHLIEAGSGGSITMELYRRRSGVFTLLGSWSLDAAAGDYATAGLVPATESLRGLERGDYLFAQATAVQSGGSDGLTVDVHFG